MIHLKFVPRLLIILFIFFIDIPQVISSLSQAYDNFHNPIIGYDLNKGPVIYQAQYPDDENSKQEKSLLYHEPIIIRNYWQTHYDTRGKPTLHILNRNSEPDLVPVSSLYQPENIHVFDDNYFHGVRNSIQHYKADLKINYNRRINNGLRHSVTNIGQKIRNPLHDRVFLRNVRDQGHLVGKTYNKYWKLANALAYPATYNTLPALFTATQEDIFQPRPQIINYKFSLPINSRSQTETMNFPKEISENGSVGTIINEQSNVLHLNQKPQIESIKVEGKRIHKIRHHHGEKSQ